MTSERQAKIDSARAILDFCENNPDIRLPFEIGHNSEWRIYIFDAADLTTFLRAARDPQVTIEDGVIVAAQSFGALRVEAWVTANEITVPDGWCTTKIVQLPELDANKIILAAKAA